MSDALFYDQLVIVRSQYGEHFYTEANKVKRNGHLPEEPLAVREAAVVLRNKIVKIRKLFIIVEKFHSRRLSLGACF